MDHVDTVIIGAGLAGLSCGLELADAGKKVLLLEAEPVVGGRTSSYVMNGMQVESGFHRYIGYYSALPVLLKKAGIQLDDIFTWEEKIEIRAEHEEHLMALGVAPLFGPLKMLKGILGNNEFISPRDKLSLLIFFLNGFKDYVFRPKELDQFNLRDYANRYGVSEDAFHYILIPLSTGLYFLPPERYSAYVFFGLLAPGLRRFYKMRIGAFLGGMTEVMCRPIAEAIERRGGIIKTGLKVNELLVEESYAVKGAVTADGEIFYAKHTVLATTLHSAKQFIKQHFEEHPWFQPMLRLPLMPAATFQIDLKKPALPKDITTFGPKTSLASFAEQSRTTFRNSSGRLSIILSHPEFFLEKTPEETLKIVLKDAKKLGMDLEDLVLDFRKVDHEYDFHSLEPGHQWLRPGQNTPVEGLILAGDYTWQPYFATMEGAVVSGQKAAQIIIKHKNTQQE